MRIRLGFVVAAGMIAAALIAAPASAGGRNPDGYGLYSPEGPPVRGEPRVYRYDPRSWYYRQSGYYPYYASSYWVPRADMRYRHRYRYYGPPYQYFPAWGYPW